MDNSVSTSTAGYTIAAAIAIIGNTLLVYAKETNPALLAGMKAMLGHHWITQGTVIVLVFLIIGFLLSKISSRRRFSGTFLAVLITLTTLAAALGLVGFFLVE